MRVTALIAAAMVLANLQSAVAAESTIPAAKEAEPAPGTSVEMPYLIAPLSSGETLEAYAYISTKIVGTSQAAALEIQQKVPFLQDAFVRDVNATTIGSAGDPTTVDNSALARRLLVLARKVMGPGKVAGVKIIQVQISPLAPKPGPSNGPS